MPLEFCSFVIVKKQQSGSQNEGDDQALNVFIEYINETGASKENSSICNTQMSNVLSVINKLLVDPFLHSELSAAVISFLSMIVKNDIREMEM